MKTINTIVQVSFAVILLEWAEKCYHEDAEYWLTGGVIFFISYFLCIVTDTMGISSLACVKSSVFRGFLSVLHGLDGVAALIIGVSIYYRNGIMLVGAMLAMTKFFLIHLLNRMILANKKTDNFYEGVTQTTKSFLHHVASFIFLRQPTEIVITTVWRTISMSGHAALVLRDRLSPKSLRLWHWCLAYLRISFQMLLLAACLASAQLRREFAHSAVGHIAYMAVRLEPVFQQGSMYLTADEKEEWLALSGSEKVAHLAKGHHPWLALELLLLSCLVLLMSVLRLELLWCGEEAFAQQQQQQSQLVGTAGGVSKDLDHLGSRDYLQWFLGSLAA